MPTSIDLAAATQSSVSCATRKPWAKRAVARSSGGASGAAASACSIQPMPFAEPASYPPRREQPGRERKRRLRIDQEQARERDAQVVVDAREHVEVRPLGLAHQAGACLKGDTEVEARMTFTDGVDLAGGGELLDGVLPDGLEQLIPAAVAELQKKRLLDEPGGEIGDSRGRLAVDRADLLDRAELEPAGEDAHAAEQAPLLLGEERVAPLHGGAEGALGPVGAPCGLREQREEIVEVRGDVLRIEAGHARGGELDLPAHRERDVLGAVGYPLAEQAGRTEDQYQDQYDEREHVLVIRAEDREMRVVGAAPARARRTIPTGGTGW